MQSEITERAKTAWNSIADEFNQWDALGLDEQETYVALTAALVDVPAVEPVAWRWKFDPDADWHYGGKEPKGFRFGDPEIVETLYPAPPLSREGEDSAEVLRSALQRISELTPARANARDARDLHLTVKAIAEVALAATRSASATSAKTWGEWEREKQSEEDQ